MVPRSIRYLFECIDRARQGGEYPSDGGDDTTFSVRASFAEIYNEQVYDLLNLQSVSFSLFWTIFISRFERPLTFLFSISSTLR